MGRRALRTGDLVVARGDAFVVLTDRPGVLHVTFGSVGRETFRSFRMGLLLGTTTISDGRRVVQMACVFDGSISQIGWCELRHLRRADP